MTPEEDFNSCSGRTCDWLKRGGLYCVDGTKGRCRKPDFLSADESDFHDSRLAEATKAIKQIISDLGENADGRKLSLVDTDMGFLLAWVEHHGGSEISLKNAKPEAFTVGIRNVTADDDDSVVAAALGLQL